MADPTETPTPYGFDLDPGEEIQRVIHRHPFDLIPTIAVSGILFIFGVALVFAEGRFPEGIPFPMLMVFVIVLLAVGLAALIFWVGYFAFRRNVLVFTNIHLVEVEQFGLLSRRVSQINFTRVQDVTGNTTGLLQTVFNYGDVEVQSAGEQEKFVFHNAPDPHDIADDVLEIHERCLREQHLAEPQE
jgi:uncharacterized membrane protein YdbT with pleckstrin-like domain